MKALSVRELIVAGLKSFRCDGLRGDVCVCGGDSLMYCESPSLTGCFAARRFMCDRLYDEDLCADCEQVVGGDCYRRVDFKNK